MMMHVILSYPCGEGLNNLVPTFIAYCTKKRGESLDDLITCAMMYYAWLQDESPGNDCYNMNKTVSVGDISITQTTHKTMHKTMHSTPLRT